MIKFNDIKIGDFLNADYEGKFCEGEVTMLNSNEKQVCVQIEGVQDFWFDTDKLQPIALNENALLNLNFTKQDAEDGGVKYSKGAFRLVTPTKGDFTHIEIWYREDRRYNPNVHFVHQLQNHYLDMTKVHLTKDII